MKRYETCKQRRKICSQRTQNLDPISEEETEKQGEHEGRDRLAFQTELLYQRYLKGEISGEEASRLFMQRRISNRDEAIRKMEIICEIRKSELKSLSSKQEKQETIESMRRLQQMIETQKRNRTSSTE